MINARVITLEKDLRVQALQETAADYKSFKQHVAGFMSDNANEYARLQQRLGDMDARINKGHPGLWKITEKVAAQAEELAAHNKQLKDADTRLQELKASLLAAERRLEVQKVAAATVQMEGNAVTDRLVRAWHAHLPPCEIAVSKILPTSQLHACHPQSLQAAELKRCLSYIDSRVDSVAAKYEVRAQVAGLLSPVTGRPRAKHPSNPHTLAAGCQLSGHSVV